VKIDGLKLTHDMFLASGEKWTVVFAKKVRKQPREITRTDCNKLIESLGMDWEAVREGNEYVIQHGRNGKAFKKGKALSWRGLLTAIKNLYHSYYIAAVSNDDQTGWLRSQGIIE
ncbi:MAG: hypothetical protein ACRC78_24020, partial [Planktothrix sp.]